MIFYSKMQGDPKNCKIVPKSALRAQFCARAQIRNRTKSFPPKFHPVHSYQILLSSVNSNYHFLKCNPNGGYHPTQARSANSLSVGPSGPNNIFSRPQVISG